MPVDQRFPLITGRKLFLSIMCGCSLSHSLLHSRSSFSLPRLFQYHVLSLPFLSSLSASLPLRGGGVLFSELSEAEPEFAHIHSLSTSDADEGCSGYENEVA